MVQIELTPEELDAIAILLCNQHTLNEAEESLWQKVDDAIPMEYVESY